MLNDFDYVVAWCVYFVCAVGLYWCLGLVFRYFRPKALEYLARSLIAVALFTPAMTVPEQNLWAPALIVAIYSYVQDDVLLATQAAMYMVSAWCVIALLLMLAHLVGRLRGAKKADGQHENTAHPPQNHTMAIALASSNGSSDAASKS